MTEETNTGASGTKAYECNWHIKRNGKTYNIGDTIRLKADEARGMGGAVTLKTVADARKRAEEAEREAQIADETAAE